jgi:hypothetical protein
MGRGIIHDLMDLFWEGASHLSEHKKVKDFPYKIFSLMSDNYRTVFEESLKAGQLFMCLNDHENITLVKRIAVL